MWEISRWGRKWRWGQSSEDESSEQGDEGEGENFARNSKESSIKWYGKEVTWDDENMIGVIWGKLYEPLIYDDILRLSSTMPGKRTFMFSTKENWFLRFFSQWELASVSEMLYESESHEGGMIHEIELWFSWWRQQWEVQVLSSLHLPYHPWWLQADVFSSVSRKKLLLILEPWMDNYLPKCGPLIC